MSNVEMNQSQIDRDDQFVATFKLKWRNGKRAGLKNRWPQGCAGSIPVLSTIAWSFAQGPSGGTADTAVLKTGGLDGIAGSNPVSGIARCFT